LLVLAMPTTLFAQAGDDERARTHFRLGEVHYEAGEYRDAAREFEEAYRLSHRPELLHNLYVAYRDAGDLEHAADALRRYLAAVPNGEDTATVRRRLAALEEAIAARAGGDPNAQPREVSGESAGGLSPVGFIVAGVGAAALIGSAITGALALSNEGELAAACPADVCPDSYEFEGKANEGRALAISTDVLLAVGAAAVATGVVLIFVLQEGSTTASAACTDDGCLGMVRGRF
jgi:tetratricopeptide (TPR) repeat protein